jgi:hypothetical protein
MPSDVLPVLAQAAMLGCVVGGAAALGLALILRRPAGRDVAYVPVDVRSPVVVRRKKS